MNADEAVIFRSRRAWRVRIAQIAVWATAVGLPLALATTPSAPPTSADWIVLALGLSLLAAFVVGMEIYLRLYVLELRRIEGGLEAATLATLHHRRVRFEGGAGADLGEERREKGWYGGVSFDNQSSFLRVPGRKLPFILDTTPPNELHRGRLEAALRQRSSAPRDGPAKRR